MESAYRVRTTSLCASSITPPNCPPTTTLHLYRHLVSEARRWLLYVPSPNLPSRPVSPLLSLKAQIFHLRHPGTSRARLSSLRRKEPSSPLRNSSTTFPRSEEHTSE